MHKFQNWKASLRKLMLSSFDNSIFSRELTVLLSIETESAIVWKNNGFSTPVLNFDKISLE
jgi:hypothetical protein